MNVVNTFSREILNFDLVSPYLTQINSQTHLVIKRIIMVAQLLCDVKN